MKMPKKSKTDGIDAVIAWLNVNSSRDDFHEAVATFVKKQFDALIKVGFTEDQATRIVAAFNSKSDSK